MKEPYTEDIASHGGPESCACHREVGGEALTGVHIGRVLSCEIRRFRVPTPLSWSEGNMEVCDMASTSATLRSRRPLACVETLCARTGRSHVFPVKVEHRDVLGR